MVVKAKTNKRKPKRSIAHVVPAPGKTDKGWLVYYYAAADPAGTEPGHDWWKRKVDALALAVEWAKSYPPSQVFIHTRDGKIADERTYGRETDPPETPGARKGRR